MTSVTTQVLNTESTTWLESSALSFSESVNWKVSFEFMRAASVREEEKNILLSKEENDALMKAYMDAVVYKEP